MSQQSIFSIAHDKHCLVSDFIVSSSNRLAYDTVTGWPEGIWGTKPYDKALLIVGPKSSGKTFLTQRWLQQGAQNSLNQKQVVIDDIDGPLIDERHLLHLFNSSIEDGKYLLLTASATTDFALPDIASRIRSLNTVHIGHPDDELIKVLIFKLFSCYSVKIADEVIDYLTRALPREFSIIQKTISEINRRSLASGGSITIPMLKKFFINQSSAVRDADSHWQNPNEPYDSEKR